LFENDRRGGETSTLPEHTLRANGILTEVDNPFSRIPISKKKKAVQGTDIERVSQVVKGVMCKLTSRYHYRGVKNKFRLQNRARD